MKTLYYSIIVGITLICFASILPYINGDSIYPNPDPIRDPFGKSDIVLVGQVLNLTKIYSADQTQYSIIVDVYLKNPKSFGLITVVGDGIKPDKITNYDEVSYYNEPVFTKDEKVFLYLKEENGKYRILPFSFGINTRVGGPPPEVIKFTSYQNTFYGNEPIIISGIIQKGLLVKASEKGNSTLTIDIYNPNRSLYLLDKIPVNVDGTFKYSFKIKGELGISGGYEYGLSLFGTTGGSFEYCTAPLKQFKSGIASKNVTCKEGLQLIFKTEDNSPACVKQQTAQTLIKYGWGTPVLAVTEQNIPILSNSVKVNNTDFTIHYAITGGKVEMANADISANVLIIYLKPTGDGMLTVDLPRGLIDAQKNGHDDKFNIQADGQVINFKEINTTNTDRVLAIPFHADTQQIEFIGGPIP